MVCCASNNKLHKSAAGSTTKIHKAADGYGLPVDFKITGGEFS